MDPRPFRCAYDPELIKASGGVQQGPKPVFVKARGGTTSDPRRREPAVKGKRTVPNSLPPAHFAKRKAREPRVHLSNLGPLVTRMQVSDAAGFFGEVKSCEMVIARTTNASLGVASVVYAGVPAIALQAADQIVAACTRGSLTIGGARGVRAALDWNRALLRQSQADAESEPIPMPAPRSHFDAKSQPLSPSPDDVNVRLVELRSLSTPQLDEWYRRFIGPNPTYVLVPHHNVSPLSCSVKEIANRFRDHAFSRIAANRTGFFVLFDSIEHAEQCFAALDGKRFMNIKLKLALTLGGERIPASELRSIRQRRHKHQQHVNSEPDLLLSNNGPAGLSPEELMEFGKTGVDALLSDMKRQAWNRFVRRTVINAVNKAIEERRRVVKTDIETSVAPVTPESELSEPETSYKSAFGLRRTLRDMGKASRNLPLPAVRMRKRTIEPVDVKSRKVLKREPVAPKTYIRDSRARKLKRSYDDDDDDNNEEEGNDDDDDNDDDDNDNDNDNETLSDEENESESETKSKMDGVLYSESKDSVATTSTLVDKMELSEEDDSIDKNPFLLPPSPPPEDYHTLDFRELKQLVRTPEDFACLQSVLHSAQLPSVSEEEVRAKFNHQKVLKLNSMPSSWPEQTTPFREAQFKVISDDERRSYLPVTESDLSNEIVQNYRYRPLYEGEEDEDDSSKLELRKDARVLSRSSFGAGSDLFADDTLSKNVKDVRLGRSFIHDWGLYASEQIPEGEFVIEYVGDVLRDEYADVRERNYMMEGIDSSYLFRLDNGTVIDATKRGNGARFINHSCDPNCVAQVFDHDGFKRVVLFSVRDIQPDEELTFDYNFVRAQDDEGKVRCACGAANCRGWLI